MLTRFYRHKKGFCNVLKHVKFLILQLGDLLYTLLTKPLDVIYTQLYFFFFSSLSFLRIDLNIAVIYHGLCYMIEVLPKRYSASDF